MSRLLTCEGAVKCLFLFFLREEETSLLYFILDPETRVYCYDDILIINLIALNRRWKCTRLKRKSNAIKYHVLYTTLIRHHRVFLSIYTENRSGTYTQWFCGFRLAWCIRSFSFIWARFHAIETRSTHRQRFSTADLTKRIPRYKKERYVSNVLYASQNVMVIYNHPFLPVPSGLQ